MSTLKTSSTKTHLVMIKVLWFSPRYQKTTVSQRSVNFTIYSIVHVLVKTQFTLRRNNVDIQIPVYPSWS